MAKIHIYAMAATFSTSCGMRCMSYNPFDEALHRDDPKEPHELRNVAEIEAAKQEVADRLKAENPARGFFVSAMLHRGERAPNGFKKLRPLEYDPAAHGIEPEAEAA